MAERRKVLKQYLFSLVLILCVTAFFCYTVTVKEKTDYNMNMTPYEIISVDKKADGLKFSYGDSEIFIRKEYVEKIGKNVFFGMLGDVFVKAGDFFEKNGK